MPSRALPCRLLLALVPLAAAGATHAADDEPVTVYRCVDAQGHVTLGDVPCAKGSEGQAREMQRPQDGAPLNRSVAATPPAIAPAAPPVVVVRTAQPMYECVTPDGERYTSDDDEGNPRWVPLWTLGRGGLRPGRPGRDSTALGDYYARRPLGGYVGAPTPRPDPPAQDGRAPLRPPRHGPSGHGFGGGGTWVRDDCHALPQAEVCARLADRRDVIRRRFFNAQERERDTLRVEERGINARLAADCGIR